MKQSKQNNLFEDADIVSIYTRAQAIEDGTCQLWADVIEPDETSKTIGQDVNGRLWDVLMVLRIAIRSTVNTDMIHFNPLFVFNGKKPRAKQLKAVCNPGDNLEPVITIMLPNED